MQDRLVWTFNSLKFCNLVISGDLAFLGGLKDFVIFDVLLFLLKLRNYRILKSIADSLMRFELVTEDPNLNRIRVHCEPDTVAIWKSIHERILKFVTVLAVKIRQRFCSKTVSFHVSVCSHVFSLFTFASSVYVFIRSFHVNIWHILPVWLPVPLQWHHDCTPYVFRWYEHLWASFYVLVIRRYLA